jgi:hypothetical protein
MGGCDMRREGFEEGEGEGERSGSVQGPMWRKLVFSRKPVKKPDVQVEPVGRTGIEDPSRNQCVRRTGMKTQ